MQRFCTLFNSFYLSRGLAMYRSLERQAYDFHLYIFAFDDACYDALVGLQLRHATIISLKEFETPELLAVKATRTAGEYCWTCTPFTIWHCIRSYALDHCTYLDADLLFFGDPKVLTDEMGEKSVLITEHRYSPRYDQSELSGIYCVQFMTFKNTKDGFTVLTWWCNACLDWCYNRFEDGKFGDQKYLDDWTERFNGIHVLQNPGGGLAPWNSLDYTCEMIGGKVCIGIQPFESVPLIFYHFHDFRYCIHDCVRLTTEQYLIREDMIKCLYTTYSHLLHASETELRQLDYLITYHETLMSLKWVKVSLSRFVKFALKGYVRNYYKRTVLDRYDLRH